MLTIWKPSNLGSFTADTPKQKKPRTMIDSPHVTLELDGIILADYGDHLMTLESLMDVIRKHETLAMVSDKKIGRLLMHLFLKINRNPYPTRAFETIEGAWTWLATLQENYCGTIISARRPPWPWRLSFPGGLFGRRFRS